MPSFITGITFDLQTGELVATSQNFEIENGAIVADGQSSESRIALNVLAVAFEAVGVEVHFGKPTVAWIGVKNTGLIPITEASLGIRVQQGQMWFNVPFTTAADQTGVVPTGPLLPSETWTFEAPWETPIQFTNQTLRQMVKSLPFGSMSVELRSGAVAVGRDNVQRLIGLA